MNNPDADKKFYVGGVTLLKTKRPPALPAASIQIVGEKAITDSTSS
jgi:hypothetical protein